MPYDQQPVSVRRSPIPARLLFAVLLGTVTVVFFTLVVPKLPSFTITQEVTGYVAIPALWLTRFIFPDGPHSGAALQYWGSVYWGSGILIYSIFWFFVLSMLWGTRRTVYGRR